MIKPEYCVRDENHCYGCEYSYEPDLFDGGCIRDGKTESKIVSALLELNKQPGRLESVAVGKDKAARRWQKCN